MSSLWLTSQQLLARAGFPEGIKAEMPGEIEGYAPWVKAVDDPLLPLLWPRLLAEIVEIDQSYVVWEETGGEGRHALVTTLRTREAGALTPRQRLDALCWLADNTLQSFAVRGGSHSHSRRVCAPRALLPALNTFHDVQAPGLDEGQQPCEQSLMC